MTSQVQLTTSKGTYLFVGVPEDKDPEQIALAIKAVREAGNGIPINATLDPVCFLSQITEEQADGIVDKIVLRASVGAFSVNKPFYRNYMAGMDKQYKESFVTALESLSTLLKANAIYTENPYGEEPDVHAINPGTVTDEDIDTFHELYDKWQTAQHTTSKEWLVIKINECNQNK